MLGKHPVLQNLFLSPEDSAISVNAECFSSSEIAVYNLSSDGGIFFQLYFCGRNNDQVL